LWHLFFSLIFEKQNYFFFAALLCKLDHFFYHGFVAIQFFQILSRHFRGIFGFFFKFFKISLAFFATLWQFLLWMIWDFDHFLIDWLGDAD